MTPRDHGPLEQPRDAEHRTKIDTTVARAYQIEMYEESLKKNVIVVVRCNPTGSVPAILRLKACLTGTDGHRQRQDDGVSAPSGRQSRNNHVLKSVCDEQRDAPN